MERAVVGRTIAVVILVGLLAACAIGFVRTINSFFAVVSDSGYYRFDNEHHLVHDYDTRISNNLSVLYGSLRAYANAHRGHLPVFTDANSLDKQLYPKYISNKKYLTNPNSARPLEPNTRLSGRLLTSIEPANNVIAFYE
jgi:hypothetical protein